MYSHTLAFDYFNNNTYQFGVSSGLNRVNNEAQMPLIQNLSGCGLFDSGVDYGYKFGLHFNIRNEKYSFYPIANLIYESRPVFLEQMTDNMEVWNDRLNSYVPLIRNFEYDGTFGYLGLNFGVGWEPLDNIPIGIEVMLDLSYPFFNSDYVKTESLIAPEGLKYPSGGDSRNYESGILPSANLIFSGIGAVFLNIETNYFDVKPSVGYRYNFNSLTSDFDWKSNAIQFQVTFIKEFDLKYEQREIIEKKPIIEIKPELPKEVISEKPKIIEDENDFMRYFSAIPINIQETIVTQTYPLLPYIFFDSASSELKPKYKSFKWSKNEFTEDSLPKNTLGIYYNILDVLCHRMKNNINSKITIVGVTDGNELSDEKERLDLAENRAKSIQKYLVYNWGIDETRIKLKSKDYPDLPTSEKYQEGFEENRRVEFYSEDFSLLSPVIHSRFIENSSTQKNLKFYAGFKNAEKIESYTIKFIQKDNQFFHYHSDKINSGDFAIHLNKNLINVIADNVDKGDSILLELEVKLTDGSIETKRTKLPVNKSMNKFELGRLNLIVFDFDKAKISESNRLMIDNFVKTSIKPNSIVDITGSSDFLGPEKYNKNLSQRRADNAREYLLEFKKDLNIRKCVGLGADYLPYNNAIPEGRFYCRTVMIEVKSEIDN